MSIFVQYRRHIRFVIPAKAGTQFVVLHDGSRFPLGGHEQGLGAGFQPFHRVAIGAPG